MSSSGDQAVLFIATSLGTKLVLTPGSPGSSVGQLRHQLAESHHTTFPSLGRVVCTRLCTAAFEASPSGYKLPDNARVAALWSQAKTFLYA